MQLSKPRVVIIGAGFGGLETAKKLKDAKVDVILIDKMNHHLFQPLLYQVATSALSPGDIAAPTRTIMRGYENCQVLLNECTAIDLPNHKAILDEGELEYDYLVLAPGARHSYFGHPEWENFAPGLKNIEDALFIREKILTSFEEAEKRYHSADSIKYTTFAIVGGGPTGVELAGAIAEIAKQTMLPDFPLLKRKEVKIKLIEGGSKLISSLPDNMSGYVKEKLEKLGVEVLLQKRVTKIDEDGVNIGDERIATKNVIWAAGNQGLSFMKSLNAELDSAGRVKTSSDFSIPGNPHVFVIGDACHLIDAEGKLVPGVAPAAEQAGAYVAGLISERIMPEDRQPFVYKDKGTLATIGRAKAVYKFKGLEFKGLFAWLLWAFVHIMSLVKFRNRLTVLVQWFWYFISFQPGARLILHYKKAVIAKENKKINLNENWKNFPDDEKRSADD